MASAPMDLDGEQQNTLEKVMSHPLSANVEWRLVRSLLEAVGTVTEEHNGKVKVTVGAETEVFQPPRGKDVEVETLADLRRMLRRAGITG